MHPIPAACILAKKYDMQKYLLHHTLPNSYICEIQPARAQPLEEDGPVNSDFVYKILEVWELKQCIPLETSQSKYGSSICLLL